MLSGQSVVWSLAILVLLLSTCRSQGKNPAKKPRSPGRHVCVESRVVTKPVKETESYFKPIYKSQIHQCEKDKTKFCTSFRVVYERASRTVYKMTAVTEEHHACCPGWQRHHLRAHGCNKPVCSEPCANGGSCAKPDQCLCPTGWTGKLCQEDVNECVLEDQAESRTANCSQRCINTIGSYLCACQEGFTLEADGRNCRIAISGIPDLEELVQGYEELHRKIRELEIPRRNLSAIVQRLEELSQAVSTLREEIQTSPPPVTTTSSTPSTSTPAPTSSTTTPTSTTSLSTTSSVDEENESRYGTPWDRINSLSDQIAMLEERLGDCRCYPSDHDMPPPVK